MFRNRNLDILLAALVAILGALAAAKNMPGQVTIPLGICLFLAPGYLWSEAILSQRLPGWERAMFAVGMTLVVPVVGGFLLTALKIPLFKNDWIGVLVVFALLGVVVALIQRLRQLPEDQEPIPGQQQQRRATSGASVVMNTFVYGVAAVVGLGAIGYSVKSAEDQPFPGQTRFSMTPVINNPLANNMAALSNNPAAQTTAATEQPGDIAKAKQANVVINNAEGASENYELVIIRNGKVATTQKFELANGQTKSETIPYTPPNDFNQNNADTKYEMLAALYVIPDLNATVNLNTTAPIDVTNNGGCLTNRNLLPTALRADDPCAPDPAASATPAATSTTTAAK